MDDEPKQEIQALAPECDVRHVTTELGLTVEVAKVLVERGTFTGLQFKKLNPAKYAACVQLLAMGWRLNRIAKDLCMAWETVKAVSLGEDFQAEIREEKQRLTRLCDQILEHGLEGLLVKAEAGKLDALALKLVLDMRQISSGGATQIVEHRGDPAVEAFKEFMRVRGTGSGDGETLAMGGAARPVAGADGPVIEAESALVAPVPDAGLPGEKAPSLPYEGTENPLKIKEL